MKIPYQAFPNFVLRTPILDLGVYKNLTSRKTVTNEQLKEVYQNPLIKEALFLASPSFYLEIEKWSNGHLDSKAEEKIRISLLKYLTRMTSRCTPFGIFAGCSLGDFSDNTQIENSEPHQNSRHTRLDMNFLVALSHDLAKDENLRDQLLYYPNSSIYKIGDQLRYVEYYYQNGRRRHHMVEVDNSPYLAKILSKAHSGARIEDLAHSILDDEVSYEEAKAFILELTQSQLLISALEPSISGPEFLAQILSVLKKLSNSTEIVAKLEKITKSLHILDHKIGNNPNQYLRLSEGLKNLGIEFDMKHLFQTDLKLEPKKSKLSNTIINDIQQGLILMNQITRPAKESTIIEFVKAFKERYEEREVALTTVLDVETGIGYLQNEGNGDVNPLVDDLVLSNTTDPYKTNTVKLSLIDTILLKKLIEAERSSAHVVNLKKSDFDQFPINWDDLPDTLSAMPKLIIEGTKEKVMMSFAGGSSSANLLGRFCHGDTEMNHFTQSITDLENKINSNKIVAEIIHLPEARVGNIVMKPHLRAYEIPYLANSVVDEKYQISISDLYISVKYDQIILRSIKHNKEVIPRLTNAHNFSFNSLPIYHFLCDLQFSGMRNGLNFSISSIENGRNFIPRIEYENVILQKAKWIIEAKEIEILQRNRSDSKRLEAIIKDFCDGLKIPQYVVLVEGDNELLINFFNITSVQMFLAEVKNKSKFILAEFLFADDGMVKSKNSYYTNEIIVSFFNENKLRDGNLIQNG